MKKILKQSKSLLLGLMVTFVALSCSSDDSGQSGTKVRYYLSFEEGTIDSITFRQADGTPYEVTVEGIVGEEWAKTVYVDAPFDALVLAQLTNNSPNANNYRISVYVDDELVDSDEGSLGAGITSTVTASYELVE